MKSKLVDVEIVPWDHIVRLPGHQRRSFNRMHTSSSDPIHAGMVDVGLPLLQTVTLVADYKFDSCTASPSRPRRNGP